MNFILFYHYIVPFVFLPTTLQTGFTFANNHSHVSTTDDQSTAESRKKKENEEENNEEVEEAGMYVYT